MAKRYRWTFKIVETEDQAKRLCNIENKNEYIRKNHKAHYTPRSDSKGNEHGFVVWYVIR